MPKSATRRLIDAAEQASTALDEFVAQRDEALAMWGWVRGAGDALAEASERYIAHLRGDGSHGDCRRQVAAGSYVCGLRLDYLDALSAYRKARGDHGA